MKTGTPRADWKPEPTEMKRAFRRWQVIISSLLVVMTCLIFAYTKLRHEGYHIPKLSLVMLPVFFVLISALVNPIRRQRKHLLLQLRSKLPKSNVVRVDIQIFQNGVCLGTDCGFLYLKSHHISFSGLETQFTLSNQWKTANQVGNENATGVTRFLVPSDENPSERSIRLAIQKGPHGEKVFDQMGLLSQTIHTKPLGHGVIPTSDPPLSFQTHGDYKHPEALPFFCFALLLAAFLVYTEGGSVFSISSLPYVCPFMVITIYLACVLTQRRREQMKYKKVVQEEAVG